MRTAKCGIATGVGQKLLSRVGKAQDKKLQNSLKKHIFRVLVSRDIDSVVNRFQASGVGEWQNAGGYLLLKSLVPGAAPTAARLKHPDFLHQGNEANEEFHNHLVTQADSSLSWLSSVKMSCSRGCANSRMAQLVSLAVKLPKQTLSQRKRRILSCTQANGEPMVANDLAPS